MSVLRGVIETLAVGQPLPAEYRDHKLVGDWRDCHECHLAGDWLLIYCIEGDALILERMGSHAELFR
jgi:mRNA interferase YafQ